MKYIFGLLVILFVSCNNQNTEVNYHYIVQVRYESGKLDTLQCDGPTLYLSVIGWNSMTELETGIGDAVAFHVNAFKILSKKPI